jgi:hypothetical protein
VNTIECKNKKSDIASQTTGKSELSHACLSAPTAPRPSLAAKKLNDLHFSQRNISKHHLHSLLLHLHAKISKQGAIGSSCTRWRGWVFQELDNTLRTETR